MSRFAIVGLAVLAVGCSSGSAPVMLGAAGPWKEGYGALTRQGIELAVAELNARGGVGGRPVEVRYKDDDADGATAAAVAEEFVANDTVLAVVGHVTSGAMVAAARVYDGRISAVATTATSPDLTGLSPWTFRVISSDSTNGLDLARFAARLGRRRAAILYENDSYGRGIADAFRRNFVGTVVSIDPIAADGSGVEPFVAYFKRLQPDVVFVAGVEVSGLALLREARRQGLTASFLGADGWLGIVADTTASEGAYVGTPFTPADTRPAARRFVAAYKAKYRAVPDGNAALGYDATMAIARAIEEAGADRRAIRDHLATLTDANAFDGATGKVRFLPNGDPIGKGFVMTRVRDGELVLEGMP